MDFAALPPEVNSARMYVGAGAAPLLAAAAAWNGIAVELSTVASSVESVITQLSTEQWMGSASLSMAAAAQPLLVWLTYTAESSELAAAQAMASAAAFETAFAMTVPPAEVAANRAQLAELIATNILGQNLSAIAATEARYGEMWAQDAYAMYSYAASSAVAARLNPLTRPPPVIDPAGAVNQAAAVGQAAASGPALMGLSDLIRNGHDAVMSFATPAASAAPTTGQELFGLIHTLDSAQIPILDGFHHNRAAYWDWVLNLCADWARAEDTANVADAASEAAPDVAATTTLARSVSPAGVGGAPALAGLGNASSVGGLSVPANWSTAAPAAPAATALAGTGWAVPEEEDEAMAVIPPVPGMAAGAAGVGTVPRYGVKPIVMPKQGLF